MPTTNQSEPIYQLLSNNDIVIDEKLSDNLDYYKKISQIMERARHAMGKKKEIIKTKSSSTISDKIIANVTPTTY